MYTIYRIKQIFIIFNLVLCLRKQSLMLSQFYIRMLTFPKYSIHTLLEAKKMKNYALFLKVVFKFRSMYLTRFLHYTIYALLYLNITFWQNHILKIFYSDSSTSTVLGNICSLVYK